MMIVSGRPLQHRVVRVPESTTNSAALDGGHCLHRAFTAQTESFRVKAGRTNISQRTRSVGSVRCVAEKPVGGTSGGVEASYLSMWKNASEKKREEELRLAKEQEGSVTRPEGGGPPDATVRQREQAFFEMLQVPEEERRAAEQQQAMDRAAAALAAAQNLLSDIEARDRLDRQVARGRAVQSTKSAPPKTKSISFTPKSKTAGGRTPGTPSGSPDAPVSSSGRVFAFSAPTSSPAASTPATSTSTRGPDFWSWVPPPASSSGATSASVAEPPRLQRATAPVRVGPKVAFLEPDAPSSSAVLDLPLESSTLMTPSLGGGAAGATAPAAADLQSLLQGPPVPAFQSAPDFLLSMESLSAPASPATDTLTSTEEASAEYAEGVMADGTRWWKTTGVDEGVNGEVCEWTVVRGVSADGGTEWEEKWWETTDAFDYKELGAEKSGRNANGGVWREAWTEAMWQDKKNGLTHMEKSADKWGRDGAGGEWQEKWWEHYDGLGRAEKWADKWSKIDPSTPLEEGHAHIWHERWGEEYDGKGATTKYCDKWAERSVGYEQWTQWGDKWDETFGRDAQGCKKGETWWAGAHGERWNRQWSEGHNGTGWVHKQGQSSSGEHWDVHEPMDTWYERKPHFGFKECLDTSRRLRQLRNKKKQGL